MSDIDRMQADAVNRAREMYSRRSPPYTANGFPNGYNGSIKPHQNNTAERKPPQDENSVNIKTNNIDINNVNPRTKAKNSAEDKKENEDIKADAAESNLLPKEDFLDMLLADKEKALIILLIALLSEEKASSSLLLALMYLII